MTPTVHPRPRIASPRAVGALLVSILQPCVVVLALAGCASTAWPDLEKTSLDAFSERYAEADEVLLVAERHVRFLEDDDGVDGASFEVTTFERVLVLRGDSRTHRRIAVAYNSSFDEVVELSARVTRPDGEVRERDLDDAIDVMAFSFRLYDDARRRQLEIDGLVPGAVLDVRQVVRSRDVRLAPARYTFAGPRPILSERFTVELPAEWEAQHLARRINEPFDWAPAEALVDGMRRWTWSLENLPAIKGEPHAPSRHVARPEVIVRLHRWGQQATQQGFTDARALSAAEHEMTRHVWRGDTARLEQLIAEAVGDVDLSDRRELAARLHAHVRDGISYCAIPIGYGGWIPHQVDEILDVGYGDCKDKATLLKALLDVVGIPSTLASIYAHDGFPNAFALPTIAGNFNHMILRVELDGQVVWADPTASTVPFGEVPTALYAAPALAVVEGGADLEVVPLPLPEHNHRRVEAQLQLMADAPAHGSAALVLTGSHTHALWGGLRSAAHTEEARRVRGYVGLIDVSVATADIDQRRPGAHPATVRVATSVELPSLVLHSDAARLLAARDVLDEAVLRLTQAEPRQNPVVLGPPRVVEHDVRIELPPGWQLGRLPAPVALTSPEADFSLSWSHDGDTAVRLQRRLVVHTAFVPAERYEALRAFFDEARAARAEAIVLTPPATTP